MRAKKVDAAREYGSVKTENGSVHHFYLAKPRYAQPSYRFMKRCFDVVVSFFALLILFPVFIIVAIAIALSDGFPVVYRQKRVGLNGDLFMIYKFRSMHRNADQILLSNPTLLAEFEKNFKLDNDPRLLPCGKFLRESSLDELPQLLNVLIGNMSLVGPRPVVERELPKYGEAVHIYTSMKPGCAGVWQYKGRSGVTYEERIGMDVEYYNTASIRRDIYVLWETSKAVIKKRGAV